MVTTKEIESLGWEHYATSANGGSKSFKKGLFTIYSHHFHHLSYHSPSQLLLCCHL